MVSMPRAALLRHEVLCVNAGAIIINGSSVQGELAVVVRHGLRVELGNRVQVRWPSGLRRSVKAAVSSDAWVRTPLSSLDHFFSSLPILWKFLHFYSHFHFNVLLCQTIRHTFPD